MYLAVPWLPKAFLPFSRIGLLAILLFGWESVKPRTHFFATVMVAFGAHFSAVWIIIANSWQQTPAGHHVVAAQNGLRAEIVDFWQMVLNPSAIDRLTHSIAGACRQEPFS